MACNVASRLVRTKYLGREKNGYCSKPWFRAGLVELRPVIRTAGSALIRGQKYATRKSFRPRIA
ncbi:hypothetical protein LY56_03396 [Roseinatronobacter thiooxidans]|uniref:Uncharacterized protein n=1 Tax=Roseinatronobacter thiooxidans TaxID=121821 RepID=A0A2W7PXV3_9RHOB|nr:hypothetical protein LY56_03396 [Roseinatronobacter thiooxidans]